MTKRETFDYIVVGAGSAGCVLANRLSEWANVLLLEAGPRDDYFWIHVPGGNAKTMRNPDVNWMFETAPDSGINGRSDYWPRGKVLGGSSSINGTIYVRGQPADYDHWARLGNEGWRWQDVLPYFLRAEGNDRGASDLHGATGPLPVTTIAERHPLIEAFIGAASELGVPRNDDFNGRAQRGAGYYQLNVRNAKRWSAAVAYLRPVAGRARLRVQTGAHATRVLMDGDRAIGIEYRHDGALHQAYAHAEVLLTAGALQSPQLLMLSGIGPAQHLRDHNLEVTLDLPGVGENLQDHLQARPAYRCTRPITVNDAAGSFFGRAKLFANWALFRRGLLASGLNQGGAFVNVLTDSAQPDMQIHLALFSSEKAGAALHPYPGFTISVCHLRPESRGRLRLASSDPLVAPHIAPGYLQSRHDVATMVASGGCKRDSARQAGAE